MAKRGFTLIEILIVMALAIVIAGLGLIVSMETFRGSNFHSDRDMFISVLQRARAEAMNSICIGGSCTDGKSHGVKILSNNTITLFQGSSYAARDPEVDSVFTLNSATTSGASEFVFSPLSGASTAATTTLSDKTGHLSTTTVSSEGQISWTN